MLFQNITSPHIASKLFPAVLLVAFAVNFLRGGDYGKRLRVVILDNIPEFWEKIVFYRA